MNYADMNIYYGTKCKLFYEAYRMQTYIRTHVHTHMHTYGKGQKVDIVYVVVVCKEIILCIVKCFFSGQIIVLFAV